MSQAVADPEELERFVQALSHFIDTLAEEVGALDQEFGALGDTWQDEKRAQFEEKYSLLLQQISAFQENASEQIPYLLALASRLRDYLQS
ncbi:MAG: WXG100 family type VII secretion target [Candidatus Thermoplasmatota archaeon]|nr:WXG100 family type VII secretion target [Candidatus Thermoplasmatota archaeon]